MGYREFVKSIPATMRELLAERLVDVMLEAKDGSRVPSSLAKTILFYWQREQLSILLAERAAGQRGRVDQPAGGSLLRRSRPSINGHGEPGDGGANAHFQAHQLGSKGRQQIQG